MNEKSYSEFLFHLVGYVQDIGLCLKEMEDMKERWDNFDGCLERLVEEFEQKYDMDLKRVMKK